jgi:hypothetical protein
LHWLKAGREGAIQRLRVSDHEGQFGEGVGETKGRTHVGPEIVEAPAEVLDEGMGSDDPPWRFGPASALAWVEAGP